MGWTNSGGSGGAAPATRDESPPALSLLTYGLLLSLPSLGFALALSLCSSCTVEQISPLVLTNKGTRIFSIPNKLPLLPHSMNYPPSYPTPSRPLQPYLGPRAHLSLSWLSQAFLALLLLAIALSLLLASIDNLVSDAKSGFVASCQGVQGAANVMVSLPHYMADGVNELNAKSVAAITEGAATVIDVALQSIEAIATFIVEMYRSLFLCLLSLIVHGSVDLLIAGTEEAEAFVTSTFQGVRTEIQDAISDINSGLSSSIGLLNDIPGVDIDVPEITIPSLDALTDVKLPSSILSSLESLNSSLPTLDSLRVSLNSLISAPIDSLRTQVNSTLSNATLSIEFLPVPAKQTVDLCSTLDTSFIDITGEAMAEFARISLGILALLAALFIAFNAFWERYRYRCYLDGVARAREAWRVDLGNASPEEALSTSNLLSFLSAAENPTLALFLARLSNCLRLTPQRRSRMHWLGNYVFHPAPTMFLFLGVPGLLMIQIQLAIVEGPVRTAVQGTASEGLGDFSAQVVAAVNGKMNETSVEFARDSNRLIGGLQEGVNEDLFGWVNGTTEMINSTLNAFYDGLTGAINDTFSGTPLNNPALELIFCLIGSKVVNIQTALTFIHTHAHITLPVVSPSVLLLSSNRTSELTSDLNSSNSSLSTTSIVDRMVDRYAQSLRQQRLGFILCLSLWGLVLVMGLFGVWWMDRGEGIWGRWRGRKEPESAGREKYDLRPFHLRTPSPTKSPVKTELAAFSFPPTSPLAPPTMSEGASWGSLIEFFKPEMRATAEMEQRSNLPLIPHRFAAKDDRRIPSPAKFTMAVSSALKNLSPSKGSRTSFGGRRSPAAEGWGPMADEVRVPSSTRVGGSEGYPFGDYVLGGREVQRPLSPPPVPRKGNWRRFPVMEVDGVRKVESAYKVEKGKTGVNPFATPFDGEDED